MKIAVTAKGKDLNSPIDPRFGRATYILVIDPDTLGFEVFDNSKNKDAFKGAGIQASVMISDAGADVLLTGYCGPNAHKTLTSANIKVVNDQDGCVMDAVNAFRQGEVTYATRPNTDGHW